MNCSWLIVNGNIRLLYEPKNIIEKNQWLDDRIMSAVIYIFNRDFSNIFTFQDPTEEEVHKVRKSSNTE